MEIFFGPDLLIFAGLFIANYLAFGVFSFFLEQGESPKRFLERILSAKKNTGEIPWHTVGSFIETVRFAWLVYFDDVWFFRWKRDFSARVLIIMFVSTLVFVNAVVLVIYFVPLIVWKIAIIFFLNIATGMTIYLASSYYTNNKGEAFSISGIVPALLCSFLWLLFPLWMYQTVKRNFADQQARP